MQVASRLGSYVPRRAGPWWLAICASLIAAIALLDWMTGRELSLSILYLAPILIAAWTLGRDAGMAVSLVATITWLVSAVYMGLGYSHPFYYVWDAAITFLTFALFALLISRLKIALDQADERFVTVLEGLDSAVWVTDASARILYGNESFRRDPGASLLGAPAGEREADRAPPAPAREEERYDAERNRWYLVSSRAIRWVDGRLVRLHRATDITERRKAEALAREQHEKLQKTARLITTGEMASTLAHEMNQPLAAIANYTTGCVRRLRAGNWDSAELLAALEKAGQQAERAGRIVQRVRAFVNKREPAFNACDVNAVIRGVTSLIETEAEKNSTVLVTDLARNLPPVLIDPVMIEQVVLNLAKNAIEAMEDTPAELRRLEIRSAPGPAGTVEVAVSDTGPGVGADFEKALATPFYTTKPQGMGLGLHICRSIVEAHSGRLRIARNAARGTTFRFALPAAPGHER